jgi:hypothetical protein
MVVFFLVGLSAFLLKQSQAERPWQSHGCPPLSKKEKEVFGDLSAQSKDKSLWYVDCAV